MNIQDCEHNQITTYGIDHLGKGMFVCKDCGILLKLVSVSDLATSDRCIAELEKRLAAAESRIAELESELVKQVRGSGVVFDICLWESIKRDGGNVTLIDEGTKQSEVK